MRTLKASIITLMFIGMTFAMIAVLAGCSQAPKDVPINVKDHGCQVFGPYPYETSHLEDNDRLWAVEHNAKGRAFCGPKWEKTHG